MRRFALPVVVLVLVAVPASVAFGAAQPAGLHVVALGDSDATGEGDASGLGWVGRYARLLRQKLGVQVLVTNLAREGKTSRMLLAEVRSEPATRLALKQAQIVLVGIGGADLGPGDERLDAGVCKGTACYAADLQRFARNLEATAGLIRQLRGPKQAVLRAMTLPNVVPGGMGVVPPFITQEIGVYQTRTLKQHICRAMVRNAGRCVDAFRAFNGATGLRDAYASGWLTRNPCCYPSGKGQQIIAELVFRSGLTPLR